MQACVHPWNWAPLLPQHCIVTKCCTVTNQQHCLALLLSCHELSMEGKGEGATGEASLGAWPSPWSRGVGEGQSSSPGLWQKLQYSLHSGQVSGKRLKEQTGFPSHKCQLCHAAQPRTHRHAAQEHHSKGA